MYWFQNANYIINFWDKKRCRSINFVLKLFHRGIGPLELFPAHPSDWLMSDDGLLLCVVVLFCFPNTDEYEFYLYYLNENLGSVYVLCNYSHGV